MIICRSSGDAAPLTASLAHPNLLAALVVLIMICNTYLLSQLRLGRSDSVGHALMAPSSRSVWNSRTLGSVAATQSSAGLMACVRERYHTRPEGSCFGCSSIQPQHVV